MARGAPSPADQQVVRELAARGVVVTPSRLESWRRAGLLSRHRRRGLGRGQGSVVEAVDPVVVETAAALARHLRQGRNRRLAVLDWFAEAGMPVLPGAAVVPEPPAGAVREALVWVLEGSVSQRLLEVARGAAGAGEEGQDALYAVAGRMLAARPHRRPVHPAVMRAALLAGEDPPDEPGSGGVVHLFAALGLGPQEVGAEALAEGFAAVGMFDLTAGEWAQMLGAAERGEAPPVPWELLGEVDSVEQVLGASDEELVRARTVLIGLRPFYAMYMLHGLFMPDTPGLAALRARIDERGLGPVLDQVISISPTPQQFAEGLVACLGGMLDELYEALMTQLATDSHVFRIPGDEHGAAGFMNTWTHTLHEQANGGTGFGDGA
ncbi:hypothetical protein [Streptomyces sp. NPDC093089]|uniref:hypothetical protein n=1 Tax=Streptomyces sp. NPDC093089 TaxID=3366024 RepID=UPI0037FDF330